MVSPCRHRLPAGSVPSAGAPRTAIGCLFDVCPAPLTRETTGPFSQRRLRLRRSTPAPHRAAAQREKASHRAVHHNTGGGEWSRPAQRKIPEQVRVQAVPRVRNMFLPRVAVQGGRLQR